MSVVGLHQMGPEKVELIKNTICKNSSDDELKLFVHACTRTGLDPFMRQIYAVKRWDSSVKKEVMMVQTGIDGYRLIAERTKRYMPGKEPSFTYDKEGKLVSATAYVKKLGPDNQWHEISATALYCEYVGLTKEGNPTGMWKSKPHIMTAKCAETLALRRAFPAELSGIYTEDELQHEVAVEVKKEEHSGQKGQCISQEQAEELKNACGDSSFIPNVLKHFKINDIHDLPLESFGNVLNWANRKNEQMRKETHELTPVEGSLFEREGEDDQD